MNPPKGTVISMVLDEHLVAMEPSFPMLEDRVLTYTQKGMVRQNHPPFKLKSVRERVPVFTVIRDNGPHGRTISTWQGLWKRCYDFLVKKGYTVKFYDKRHKFPAPRLDRMFGFRFKQESLLVEALKRDISGLIGAPTRYGKTTLIINTLRAYEGLCCVVLLPGEDLLIQTRKDIQKAFPHIKVGMFGAGSTQKYQSNEITICSMDSMHKLNPGMTELILIDEPHALVTDKRLGAFTVFAKARKLGFGATLDGRYDGKDIMIEAMIGPVLANRTYREAVLEGAVCQNTVFAVKVPVAPVALSERDAVYKYALYENSRIGSFLTWVCKELLPPEWQSIFFIKNENSAEFYKQFIGEEGTIAMAKQMNKKERRKMLERMKSSDVKRCLASVIYSTGVTFSHLRMVANLEGGGPYTGNIQKPGRVAEVIPGKKRGVIFDFIIYPLGDDEDQGMWSSMHRECRRRIDRYQTTGYEIFEFDIDNRTAIRAAFEAVCL